MEERAVENGMQALRAIGEESESRSTEGSLPFSARERRSASCDADLA
jgi:hypothetical protein